MKKQLVVIGGGAAGFFCAITAARLHPEMEVVILEKTSKLLSKVRISGGGRCNVTHALFDIAEMSNCYPRGKNFVKKSFYQFFTSDTIQWFKERGVEVKAEADGRMFPITDSSQTIIDCLMLEARTHGVHIRLNAEVQQIQKEGFVFTITMANSQEMTADVVCIACGGYPKTSMFQWLLSTGHTIAGPVPSLFTFNLPQHPITQLMGVSLEKIRLKIAGTHLIEEGPMLITHWGLSGPVVLRLSAWGARELHDKNYLFDIQINWLPHQNSTLLKDIFMQCRAMHSKKKVINQNPTILPTRLWHFLIQQSGIPDDMRYADLPFKLENIFINKLLDDVVQVTGKTTFKEEFVTSGGISLNEVNPQTMMSKLVPNLFFAGEVLDVDGITGGFNFQHAWTSGWVAAQSIYLNFRV